MCKSGQLGRIEPRNEVMFIFQLELLADDSSYILFRMYPKTIHMKREIQIAALNICLGDI